MVRHYKELSKTNATATKADEVEIATYTVYPGIEALENFQFAYTSIKSDADIDELINNLIEIITLKQQLATKMSDLQFRSKYDI